MKTELIRVENLTKTYQTPVLKDCNLTVTENDYISIVGHSGSGKSTLVHILGLMDHYDDGSIYFKKEKLDNHKDYFSIRSKYMGFIFQSYNLINHLSVKENIFMPAVFSRLPYSLERVQKLFHRLGIEELLDRDVSVLSGGEKQRVAICRALLFDPPIIIADEPTGNLDSVNERRIFDLFKELHKENKTIIVITHNTERAKEADTQYVLQGGRLHVETTD